jgi:hypothetical protein
MVLLDIDVLKENVNYVIFKKLRMNFILLSFAIVTLHYVGSSLSHVYTEGRVYSFAAFKVTVTKKRFEIVGLSKYIIFATKRR